MEAQPVTDDLLPACELALYTGPLIVAAVALLGYPPFPGDRLDVAVALGGVGVRHDAEYGIGARWNYYLRIRMALVQGGGNIGSVIAAVAHEDLDVLGDLVEPLLDLGGVIDVTLGQDGSYDPAGYGVKADVQLAPGTPFLRAVLFNQPLAWAAQLQARAVNQQVDRPAGGARLRRQLEALCAPAQGRELAALALTGSGTDRSRMSSWRTELINPSVWRSGRWNNALSVRAVVIAKSE